MIASQHEQRLANEIQLQNDPNEMRANQQLEFVEEQEQQMEGIELSETQSVI